MSFDLSTISDLDALRVMAQERPEFGDIIEAEIGKGRTDDQIVKLVCKAGGSPQAMRWARKCVRAMRELLHSPSDKIDAERDAL